MYPGTSRQHMPGRKYTSLKDRLSKGSGETGNMLGEGRGRRKREKGQEMMDSDS